MGNSASTHQQQQQQQHPSRKHHSRFTAAASLSSQLVQPKQHTNNYSTTHSVISTVRKRKSLELPDLNQQQQPPIIPPTATGSHFQLKLNSSSPLTTPLPLSASPLSATYEQLKLNDDSSNLRSTTTPPDHLHQLPGLTLPASPTPIQPDSDQPIPPKQLSPLVSSAPLQQPVETVVPPIPPAIIQPLPSLDPDTADLPSSPSDAFTSAVTETVAAATAVVQAAPALDIGAGPDGVPTLLTWKEPANDVYVTGTFSRWKQQIKLRKPAHSDTSNPQHDVFSALVALPPGPHQLKFIVDRRWKTSKYLPSATDDKGNLINYLQVNPGDQPFRGLGPRGIWSGYTYADWPMGSSILEDGSSMRTDSEDGWTTSIPAALLDYEEYHDRSSGGSESEEPAVPDQGGPPQPEDEPIPGHPGFAAEPPKLPAQLKEGILNLSSRLPEGSSDDNSLLPRPDHSVLNHLAASPIRQGLLSVGVTSRFKRKYLTTVYYKPVDL